MAVQRQLLLCWCSVDVGLWGIHSPSVLLCVYLLSGGSMGAVSDRTISVSSAATVFDDRQQQCEEFRSQVCADKAEHRFSFLH